MLGRVGKSQYKTRVLRLLSICTEISVHALHFMAIIYKINIHSFIQLTSKEYRVKKIVW